MISIKWKFNQSYKFGLKFILSNQIRFVLCTKKNQIRFGSKSTKGKKIKEKGKRGRGSLHVQLPPRFQLPSYPATANVYVRRPDIRSVG